MSKLFNWSRWLTLPLLGILVLSGCGQEQDDDKKELILGRWEIQQAFRDGQATETLDKLYFEFFKDGQMRTNLMGAETATYELEDSQLYQRDSQMDIDYTIESIGDSTMVLTTQLRDSNFRFQLRRSVQEE